MINLNSFYAGWLDFRFQYSRQPYLIYSIMTLNLRDISVSPFSVSLFAGSSQTRRDYIYSYCFVPAPLMFLWN